MVFWCLVPKMTLKEEYKEPHGQNDNPIYCPFSLTSWKIHRNQQKKCMLDFSQMGNFFRLFILVDILLIRYTRNGGLLLILMTIVMTRRKGYKIKTRSNATFGRSFYLLFFPKMKATAGDTECNQIIVNRCKLIRQLNCRALK